MYKQCYEGSEPLALCAVSIYLYHYLLKGRVASTIWYLFSTAIFSTRTTSLLRGQSRRHTERRTSLDSALLLSPRMVLFPPNATSLSCSLPYGYKVAQVCIDRHASDGTCGCLLSALREYYLQGALGTTRVLVTMKKISRRKITSVIDAMLKTSIALLFRFSFIGCLIYYAFLFGSLRRSMNSSASVSDCVTLLHTSHQMICRQKKFDDPDDEPAHPWLPVLRRCRREKIDVDVVPAVAMS